MNTTIRSGLTILVLVIGFVLSACSTPPPIIIVVTATPLPALPPTAVPISLPGASANVDASANLPTPIPPSTPTIAPTTQVTSVIPATSTNTPQPQQPPPPPAQPTATPVLPQLGVFDQGGGAMELTMLGPSVANKFLVFRAVVCNPDCKNRPDGKDVDSVKFTFFKWNTQGGGQRGAKVFEQTEGAAPYCSFGGSDTCNFISLSDKNVKWPGTNSVIDNGEYYFEVQASGKNNRNWNGNFRFRVQR